MLAPGERVLAEARSGRCPLPARALIGPASVVAIYVIGIALLTEERVRERVVGPWFPLVLVVGLELRRRQRWRGRRYYETSERVLAVDDWGRWLGQFPRGTPLARCDELPGGPVEVEDLLAPGERIEWQGKPSGLPPPRTFVGPACLAYLGLGPLGLLRKTIEDNCWLPWAPDVGETLTLATIAFVAWSLRRIAAYRGRRYAITDRRVLAIDEKGRCLGQDARGAPRTVQFEGLAEPESVPT